MRHWKLYVLALFISVLVFSCEDEVEIESQFTEPQLVVEAWLTDEPTEQIITLTQSQDYFVNEPPVPVDGAQIGVCRNSSLSDCIIFEPIGRGRYRWTPAPGQRIGAVGDTFSLGIRLDGRDYLSVTTMDRVPEIDSISFQFEEASLGLDEGFYGQIYARDFVGRGDGYLIRSFINDTLLLRPAEANLVYDAGFDFGTDLDGISFIFPIRVGINRLDDDGGPVPLSDSTNVRVEIWSLSDVAFLFLGNAIDQINNGDAGIFQLPVANSQGNVVNVNSGERILGVFNVAAVSSAERLYTEE